MLQPLETQYLQHESHRIIRRCLISSKRPVSKTGNAFLRLDLKKLSHFHFEHKDNANGTGGSSGSLVLLLFTRFSRDCTEISLFGSSEVYRSRPDVLGRSARGPPRTFSDVAPGKGLRERERGEGRGEKERDRAAGWVSVSWYVERKRERNCVSGCVTVSWYSVILLSCLRWRDWASRRRFVRDVQNPVWHNFLLFRHCHSPCHHSGWVCSNSDGVKRMWKISVSSHWLLCLKKGCIGACGDGDVVTFPPGALFDMSCCHWCILPLHEIFADNRECMITTVITLVGEIFYFDNSQLVALQMSFTNTFTWKQIIWEIPITHHDYFDSAMMYFKRKTWYHYFMRASKLQNLLTDIVRHRILFKCQVVWFPRLRITPVC